jgi:hypothetical protein
VVEIVTRGGGPRPAESAHIPSRTPAMAIRYEINTARRFEITAGRLCGSSQSAQFPGLLRNFSRAGELPEPVTKRSRRTLGSKHPQRSIRPCDRDQRKPPATIGTRLPPLLSSGIVLHDGLNKDTPAKRPTVRRNGGEWLKSTPRLGGLHYRHSLAKAAWGMHEIVATYRGHTSVAVKL